MLEEILMTRPAMDRELFLNQELSLLDFHARVLAQARDPRLPLLERLQFLCISCTNLDEFFEIRVAGLKQQQELGDHPLGPDLNTPTESLEQIRARVQVLVKEQYEVLNKVVIPALEEQGIRCIPRESWTEKQVEWLTHYFEEELLPVLSPMGLDPAHPFPRIQNKSLNFIVSLKGEDAFGRKGGRAVVQAPRSLPRVIRLPMLDEDGGSDDFVFLSSVIHTFVGDLFPGMKVQGCYQFRVTRDADLFVDEEDTEDLLRAVEGELFSRRYGEAVRLEVADECPEELTAFLLDRFGLEDEDLYRASGPVNLNRLHALYDLVTRPDLKYPSFNPGSPLPVQRQVNWFQAIRDQDLLFHHPFQSFLPVLDFLHAAANDPDVLAIKQTLYRTEVDSVLVEQLVEAALAGKEVTVVIELMARFDEEANIALANQLQEAGAHVVYGIVGHKTHAKMLLVVRRESSGLRKYVHLGTGNYHTQTTRRYTDYGLLTADKKVGEDVHRVFLALTSFGKEPRLKRLIASPFQLHRAMLEKIERETRTARDGGEARIIIKVNSLVEAQVIEALYEASQAGVKVDLIVRGMCRLRPGVAGVSDNIRVRSIVGRFLEHTRVFYFHNGDDPEVYCSSADWRERNFFRRVELCFPVLRTKHKRRILADLELYLRDDSDAWELNRDGEYRRLTSTEETATSAQRALLNQLAEPAT